MVIQNGSRAYEFWLQPPVKMLRKYYLFDVKNSKEVINGAKPVLVQYGPYTYSETWTRENVTFLNQNLLQFSPTSTLIFEPSLSVGNLTDKITILNIPALVSFFLFIILFEVNNNIFLLKVIAEKTSNKFSRQENVLNRLFDFMKVKLFQVKTVNEIISGYEDPLMKIAKNVDRSVKESKFGLLNGVIYFC